MNMKPIYYRYYIIVDINKLYNIVVRRVFREFFRRVRMGDVRCVHSWAPLT